MPSETILILGGTREAADLAARLVAARPGARVITSLAGRTREPAPVAGEVRVGGFGGIAGLTAWLNDTDVTTLIDATHPFAETISGNAVAAAAATGTPLLRLARPAWTREQGDLWTEVDSLDAAAEALPKEAVALLALGSQYLAQFAARTDCRFIVRMVDPPETPLSFAAEIVLGKPSADPREEAALFRRFGLTHLVCRNSGGAGAYAKIAAAREMALPVIMVARPQISDGRAFATVDLLLAALSD